MKRIYSPYVKPALFFKDASSSYDTFNVAHAPRIFLVNKKKKRRRSSKALRKLQREREEEELQRQLMMQYLAE